MDDKRSVRDAAVEQAVTTLVYIGLMLALSYALANRDALTRAAARAGAWWRGPEPGDGQQVAEFNRDVSTWDHRERGR